MARTTTIAPEAVRAEPSEGVFNVTAGDRVLVVVTEADARVEAIELPVVARVYADRIRRAVRAYRDARRPAVLLDGARRAAGATAAFAAALLALLWAFARLRARLSRRYQERIHSVQFQSFEILRAQRIRDALDAVMRFVRLAASVVLVYFWLHFVLSSFPVTRPLALRLLSLVLEPLSLLGAGLLAQLPNLLFLLVLYFVTRWLLGLMRLFFDAVAKGRVELSGFEPEWALPTYRILRLVGVGLALVVAYPYIPGSQSAAFQGLSIFLGVMLSLGSSSFISNSIAGYSMTYRRAFRVGDRIQVGETFGDVTEIRLQVTHLRSLKNEEIVVPNSMLLNSSVVNYSALARSHGLILHTTVGIGYETPWRQVEAMLLMAAERTEGLAREPAPFVLQKALGDFCVTYELNAYCRRADGDVAALHAAPPEHPRRLQRVRRADHDPGIRGRSRASPRSCRGSSGGAPPRERKTQASRRLWTAPRRTPRRPLPGLADGFRASSCGCRCRTSRGRAPGPSGEVYCTVGGGRNIDLQTPCFLSTQVLTPRVNDPALRSRRESEAFCRLRRRLAKPPPVAVDTVDSHLDVLAGARYTTSRTRLSGDAAGYDSEFQELDWWVLSRRELPRAAGVEAVDPGSGRLEARAVAIRPRPAGPEFRRWSSMKKTLAALAALVALPLAAHAQKPVTQTDAVELTTKIEAIDHTKRMVTLKDKDGVMETIHCGPEVKRFDELKVGDTVTFRYQESIAYSIRKPGQPSGLPANDRSRGHPRHGPQARRDARSAGDGHGHGQGDRPEGPVGHRPHRGRPDGELQGRGQEEPRGREGRRQGGDHLHRGRHHQRQVRAICSLAATPPLIKKERTTMIRKTILAAGLVALAAATAQAQEPRVEISGTAGWTFSDGVSGGTTTVNGEDFSRIDPKDAFSWGARIGFFATPNVEIGALFSSQATQLEISGVANTIELGDEKVYNYHGYVAYNFGDSDASVRPYFLGGLGATQYGTVNVNIGGVQRDIGGNTKFSTTWALGVKLYPSKSVGLRLEGRWTPTYIKSDATGWWCDPYWGCYATGNAQYANQFEMSGGITLRF